MESSSPVTFLTAGAVVKGDRVKLDSAGSVVVGGVGDTTIGAALDDAASGAYVPVALFGPSVVELRAAGAFSIGTIYAAASGAVDDAVTASLDRFTALKAATAAEQLVPCLPLWIGAVS